MKNVLKHIVALNPGLQGFWYDTIISSRVYSFCEV